MVGCHFKFWALNIRSEKIDRNARLSYGFIYYSNFLRIFTRSHSLCADFVKRASPYFIRVQTKSNQSTLFNILIKYYTTKSHCRSQCIDL